jgi:UDP-N-acetylglucosamine acyltransferase
VAPQATAIHPLALVDAGATLGAGVRIGPFCQVGPDVVLGDNVELVSHVSVTGVTTVGANCKVFPQAVLGQPPQNNKHKGGPTRLTIGANCTIREGVTMHCGSDSSRGETTVGNNCNLLAYVHIAHDCVIGNNVTMANLATLGGHVEVGDFANIGGMSAVHQMTRVGHHAFIGGMTGVFADLIPYGMAVGDRAGLRGLNIIGMKRSGLSRPEIHALRNAFKMIFDSAAPMRQNLDAAAAKYAAFDTVRDVIDFMSYRGKRAYLTPRHGQAVADDDNDDE